MGWADCGEDRNGRPIGYGFKAKCDHPGCTRKIDRGVSYACADMHGEDVVGCERYFCNKHRQNLAAWPGDPQNIVSVCDECAKRMRENGEWVDDDGVLTHVDDMANRESEGRGTSA
jgi:hypothetical protein